MNCREFEADVVELARGAELAAAVAARLGPHLEHCAGCTARFASERRLTKALKAVADAAPPSTRVEAIEAQLLAAFARQRAAAPRPTPSRWSVVARPRMRAWLAAAAVLVLAVAAWQGAARWPPSSGGRPGSPDGVAGDARPTPGGGGGEVLRFVTLPTAIGLPTLESGRIVRVALPAAELPAFGFDVVPPPAAGAVEADVLVGQDGQPRAIRFVTLEADSRRPQ